MERTLPSVPTKTTAPARRPDTIRRPRLLNLLRSGLAKRLSIVAAPSGFGKSALLADFAADLEVPVSWLTLERWDGEARELLNNLARALLPDGQVDSLDDTSLDKLRRQLRLVVWSSSRGRPRRVVILDDFQAIEASQDALALIEELLESAREDFHVVIASRELPALAGLARLVAQGSALCLGIEDLSFDDEEVRRFFAEVRGVEISEAQAGDLLDRTGGWPASVALFHLTPESTLESGARGELFLEDLMNETFERQTALVRRFLLSTSILKDLESSFCDELLAQTSSRKALKELERRNVFATRIEADPPVYRLHKPFRQFLKDKLRAERGTAFLTLCGRAGVLSETRGDWEAAIPFFVEAQMWPDAVRALREASESLLSYGRAATLGRWLDSLPREFVRQNPDLVLLRARAHLDAGDLDESLQVIADLLQQGCGETLKGLALLYRGVCLSRKGQHQEAIRTGRRAVSILVKEEALPQIEAEAYLRLGVAIGASGQFARAVPSLKRALSLAESLGDVRTASIAADGLGDAFVNMGQIAEAQSYFERARQGWASLGNDYRLVLTLNNLGVMYSWLGDYELSIQLLSEAAERSRATGNARIEGYAILSLGDVKRDTGGYQEALDLYNDGLEKARHLGEAYFVDYAVDALGMTHMLMGDLTKAEVLIRHAAAEVAERGGLYQTGTLSLSLGILSHLKANFVESAGHLENAVRVLKSAGAARDEARAHFHLAHVYLATNSRRRALAALQEVARLVKGIGYSAFLAADARRCPALTAFAASKRIGDGLFARLREEDARRRARGGKAAAQLSLGPTYPPLEAFGFGESAVRIDGRVISDPEWSSLKSKEMFFFFLTNHDPCSRDECCAALWPDFDQARATSNFHSTLYRLRSATYFDVVSVSNGRYRLNPAASFWFDAEEFERLVQDGDGRPATDRERIPAFERAAELYGGPFGREFYSEWSEDVRRRLEDKYLRVLAILAGHAYAGESHEKCLEYCERILALDDGNDEAHCLRIETFLALGDRVSAVAHLDAYRRYLSEEAAIGPTERLSEVARRIAATRS